MQSGPSTTTVKPTTGAVCLGPPREVARAVVGASHHGGVSVGVLVSASAAGLCACPLTHLLQAVLSVTWPLTSELKGWDPSHCVHPSSRLRQEPSSGWKGCFRWGPLRAPTQD